MMPMPLRPDCEENALPMLEEADDASAAPLVQVGVGVRGQRLVRALGVASGVALGACLLLGAAASWGSSSSTSRSGAASQFHVMRLNEQKSAEHTNATTATSVTTTTPFPVEDVTKDLIAKEAALNRKVQAMTAKAKRDAAAADNVAEQAQNKKEAALKVIAKANNTIAGAIHDTAKSKAMKANATAAIKKSEIIITEMKTVTANAKAQISQAESRLADAAEKKSHGEEMQTKVNKLIAKAAEKEQKALDMTAANRKCVDLPGVRLRSGQDASDFGPIAVEKDTGTPELCRLWCLEHEGCAQAVFVGWNKKCQLTKDATTKVLEFDDAYNSTFCGEDKDRLMDKLHVVFDQKPYIPPPVECSWSGDDCSKTKCCNDQECKWDFSTCKGFTCYKNQPFSGSCMSKCYGPNCQVIGGPREPRLIPKAKEGKTLQGTSLFCFMVVAWAVPATQAYSDPESALADQQKKLKVGIFQCDANQIFSGNATAKTDWATYLNADMFISVWKQVQQDGQYASHDWTVKVDADAVFFPNILKQHLEGWRVPQGARVYMRNIACKFRFLGALQVLTKQALDFYFTKGWVCQSKPHDKQGEDFYMKACLEAVGVDYIEDTTLLHAKECEDTPGSDGKCSDKWAVAFHSHRTVTGWKGCYDQAVATQR